MSKYIDLSAHTHTEDMDGRRYLVTTDIGTAIAWPMGATECGCEYGSGWEWQDDLDGEEWGSSEAWRIPLTDVVPVYEYRESERWSAIGEFDGRECIYLDWGCLEAIEPDDAVLRDLAAMVCEGPEQFRALHRELKEARGG